MPGMYVVTSTAFVRRTRATLRSAEFGFFGVWVYTRMHTPRFSGQPISAGDLVLETIPSLPIRTSCENVGTVSSLRNLSSARFKRRAQKPCAQTDGGNSRLARRKKRESTRTGSKV